MCSFIFFNSSLVLFDSLHWFNLNLSHLCFLVWFVLLIFLHITVSGVLCFLWLQEIWAFNCSFSLSACFYALLGILFDLGLYELGLVYDFSLLFPALFLSHELCISIVGTTDLYLAMVLFPVRQYISSHGSCILAVSCDFMIFSIAFVLCALSCSDFVCILIGLQDWSKLLIKFWFG